MTTAKVREKAEKYSSQQYNPVKKDVPEWATDIHYNKNNEMKNDTNNLVKILNQHPDFVGKLRMNEFTRQTEYDGKAIADIDFAQLRYDISSKLSLDFKSCDIAQQADVVARVNRYNPLVDYLNATSWDGKDRVDDFIAAMAIDPTEMNKVLIRKWLLTAVARAMKPGCKADNVLIIVGKTGNMKSTALLTLCPNKDWFTDEPINFGEKDSKQLLLSKWIVELAECASFKKKENNVIKADLSKRKDEFRSPYGRTTQSYPRQFIYVATSNDTEILTDTTSNRRFWIVENIGVIDIQKIEEMRDQLWAQIVCAYKAGEKWFLDKETENKLADDMQQYQTKDVWYDRVEAWVSERRYATTTEILQQCCGIDIGRIDNIHKNRIRSIMQLLGWKSGTKRVGGVPTWSWINPNETIVNGEEGSFDNVIPFSKPLDSDTFSEHVGREETEKTK